MCARVWVREKREDVISGIDIFISLRFNSSQTHTPHKLNNWYRYPDTDREGEGGGINCNGTVVCKCFSTHVGDLRLYMTRVFWQ